jgi:peptidyl-dipeptidase A
MFAALRGFRCSAYNHAFRKERMHVMRKRSLVFALMTIAATAAAQAGARAKPKSSSTAAKAATGSPKASPTVAEAEAFIREVEARLNDLSVRSSRASWVQANFITDDTQVIAAQSNDEMIAATTQYAERAKRFARLKLPPDAARKLMLLRLSLSLPAPSNAAEREELTTIASSLAADYGKGKYCPANAAPGGTPQDDDKCLDVTAIERLMSNSRDEKQLRELWLGWHRIAPPMRQRYARFVELSNKGAREMGFADVGAMWRSNYDMTPEQFSAELERLWVEMRPFYESLHAYVRARLVKQYGPDAATPDGLIRAHLFGNIWAQEWGHIYPLVAPATDKPAVDLNALLQQKKVDPLGMVRYGENFFKSLGFAPLPKTFWERSLFTKPRDRDVVCHASAWTIDNKEDLRLKMCIQVRDEDFVTVHHELGHNFYQRAYNRQPYLFQGGANDGFHEAVGDSIALSITPEYLKEVGLLAEASPAQTTSDDTAILLRQALDKIAFLPFGLLIDQWRWKVFSGEVKPADYNKAWWELRAKYQGVAPPEARSESDFDPGAKYHVPANTPYTRYFLARILQFQFYRAMCRAAGHTGPLYRCSFYNNKAAGGKLQRMLAAGQSKPWQETLYEMTGERDTDAGAMLEYFAPLKRWLDEQNRGQKVGWTAPAATRSGSGN